MKLMLRKIEQEGFCMFYTIAQYELRLAFFVKLGRIN